MNNSLCASLDCASKALFGIRSFFLLLVLLFLAEDLLGKEVINRWQMHSLREQVKEGTPAAIVSFQTAQHKVMYGGKTTNLPLTSLRNIGEQKEGRIFMRSELAIKGSFSLVRPIFGKFPERQDVDDKIAVDTRWGGSPDLLRLKPLLKEAEADKPTLFICFLPEDSSAMINGHFVGPIPEEHLDKVTEFLKSIMDMQKRGPTKEELAEIVKSGDLLRIRYALGELEEVDEYLMPQHFLTAVASLSDEESSELAKDLVWYTIGGPKVQTNLVESLTVFLDGKKPAKEAAVLEAIQEALRRGSWPDDESDFTLRIKKMMEESHQ